MSLGPRIEYIAPDWELRTECVFASHLALARQAILSEIYRPTGQVKHLASNVTVTELSTSATSKADQFTFGTPDFQFTILNFIATFRIVAIVKYTPDTKLLRHYNAFETGLMLTAEEAWKQREAERLERLKQERLMMATQSVRN